MENLLYANEFLKKLEPVIVKNDFETLQKIKETLVSVVEEKSENIKLENLKTKTNEDIFFTEIPIKRAVYKVFWTVKDEKKIIITLTKDTK